MAEYEAAEVALDEPVETVPGTDAQRLGVDEVDHPVEARNARHRQPYRVGDRRLVAQAEPSPQSSPRRRPVCDRWPRDVDRCGEPPGEVLQVRDQRLEVHLAAGGHRFELRLPVIVGEIAVGYQG